MKTNYSAFTLAEILITLGIIGVAAALTMPVLIAKQKQAVLNAQFKKAYSLFTNAVFQAQAQMGYPAYCSYWPNDVQKQIHIMNVFHGPVLMVLLFRRATTDQEKTVTCLKNNSLHKL